MLPEGLPEFTLGWEVLQWGSQMLAQPDGDNAGDSWIYSAEQAKFILWFYAIDKYGRFLFRNATLERPKGWGKSPLLAAICCTELLGPTNFAGWDAEGKPVGKPTPSPLVQIAAISDSQAENTMSLVREMLANGQAMYHFPQLEINLSKIIYPGGKKLEKVTASPRGREGNRATFVVMDETHLWVPAEKGPELFEALSRNLAKMDHRWVATTNAHCPGEGSVAEERYHNYLKTTSLGFEPTMLFDTREVFVEDIYDEEQAVPALAFVYGDAAHPDKGWINIDNIMAEVKETREHVARRFFFNQHVEGHTTWLTPALWVDCKSPKLENKKKLKKGDVLAVGFKGTQKRGASIIGCRLEDSALFELGWWENPNIQGLNWDVPHTEIDARMKKIMSTYNVFKVVAAPPPFDIMVSSWAADYEDTVEEFYISSKANMSKACEQFESAVNNKQLRWISPNISRHVLACHTEETPNGYMIRQESKYSQRYIFGAQAAVLALEAAVLSIEEGALKPMVDSTLYTF